MISNTPPPMIIHNHSIPCTGRESTLLCCSSLITVLLLSLSCISVSLPVTETVSPCLSRTDKSTDPLSLISSCMLRTFPVVSYSVRLITVLSISPLLIFSCSALLSTIRVVSTIRSMRSTLEKFSSCLWTSFFALQPIVPKPSKTAITIEYIKAFLFIV